MTDADIMALRRATVALALELPGSVYDYYAPLVHAALDEVERLTAGCNNLNADWHAMASMVEDYKRRRDEVLAEIERMRPLYEAALALSKSHGGGG